MYSYQHNLIQIRTKVFILCVLSIIVSFICKRMMSHLFNFDNHIMYQVTLFMYVRHLFIWLKQSEPDGRG